MLKQPNDTRLLPSLGVFYSRSLRFGGRRRSLAGVLASLWFALLVPQIAAGQAGALDPSFNGTGEVFTDFGSTEDFLSAVLVDGQGRVVAVGNAYGQSQIAVARYRPDGALDPTFGSGGRVLTPVGPVQAAVIDHQGRIVVTGFAAVGARTLLFLLRINDDGTVDRLFGNEGIVLTDLGGLNGGSGRHLTLDAQGRILVAGTFHDGASLHWVVLRYDGFFGSLDDSFGTGGIVETTFDSGPSAIPSAIAVDDAGRIIVAGNASIFPAPSPGAHSHFAVARYMPSDGSLDSSFGAGGKVLVSFSTYHFDRAKAIAIDSQDRIVVAGDAFIGDAADAVYFALARLNAHGGLDTTFGNGAGRVLTGFGTNLRNFANGVVIDSQGRVVVFGHSSPDNVSLRDLALARYNGDGSLDASFGDQGTVVTEFPTGDVFIIGASIALDSQDRIVVGGGVGPGDYDFGLARYLAVASADLAVTKTAPNTAVAGDLITYTITLTNFGPSAARDVTVTDALPSSVTFVSCTTTAGGICAGSGNHRVVTFSSLSPGASATIVVQAALAFGVPDGSSVTNVASVTAATDDPNPGNNTASAATIVQNRADLRVSLSVVKLPNRELRYLITAENLGAHRAGQVWLNDTVPASTRFVSLVSGAWDCNTPPAGGTGTVSCALASMDVGAVETMVLVVKTTAPGNLDVTNTVSVGAATFDPNVSNNSATLVTRVSGK